MKSVFTIVTLPLLLATYLFSCDKENYPTYRMEEDFKPYVLFPVGSYWVYNQAGTNRVDSVYLYDQLIKVNDTRKAFRFNYEDFTQRSSSSYYKDTLIAGSGVEKVNDIVFYFLTEGNQSSSQERNLQFFTKHEVGSTLKLTESMEAMFVEQYDIHKVNGIEYHDVKVFENAFLHNPLSTKRIYYARGVGVISKELFNGQVWNLQRYKIL